MTKRVSLAVLVLVLGVTPPALADYTPVDPAKTASPPQITTVKCPDIEVQPIFTMAARTSKYAGQVTFTGYYKNIGNAAFAPPTNGAHIQLWENFPGQPPKLVAQHPVFAMDAGAISSNNFKYTRPWSATGPEATNPATYRLVFVHEKGVLECNKANNAIERSGASINAEFHWPA